MVTGYNGLKYSVGVAPCCVVMTISSNVILPDVLPVVCSILPHHQIPQHVQHKTILEGGEREGGRRGRGETEFGDIKDDWL